MNHNLSPKIVNTIVTNVHEVYEHSNNHWWIKLINNRLWISLWIIVTMIATTGIVMSITISGSKFIKTPLAIISIIGFIISCFFLTQSFVLKTKIRDSLLQQLPIEKYYQLIISDNNSQMFLEKITDYWEIEPQGNLPLDQAPDYYNYCENVMIGTINGQKFNYGSVINQKVMYERDLGYNSAGMIIDKTKTTCYYTRFVYYTTIIKNQDFIMTLTPRNIFSKKFRNRKKVQLESNLFEDLFEVKANNQIKLRLILEPKVINLLNEFAASLQNKDLPVIHIENERLTLNWKYNLGKNSYRDGKGKLMCLPSTLNYENFINKLLEMLSEDILNLIQAQTWINNLSLLS